MDIQATNEGGSWHRRRAVGTALIVLAVCGAIFLIAKTATELKGYSSVGTRPENTIVVTGQSEIYVKPNVGTFTFTVREEASSVVDAQKKATDKNNAVLAALKAKGISEEKDLKPMGYNVYPKYEYQQTICTATFCPPSGKQRIYAYEVSQTYEVKVRQDKLATVGELLTAATGAGASEVSGLQFTLEDEEGERSKAREEAIKEARAKARVLADQLDVDLGRVVSFSENGGPVYPLYYKGMEAYGRGGAGDAVAQAAPSIPTGENKIESYVTIVYEIR